ncbi:hypothetical protein [Brevundimonas sp. EAKA]|uniref:hypothetical protein n=1 Tax=Brevundimonas sp. EAKA TaxID=1495854 RepID=UPI000B069D70|nr:hypothetical protein [Brevundimonas sp. EAKA]
MEAQLDQLQHAANQGGSTAALVIAQNQLSRLGGLGQTIEHARGVSLASIRAEVTAVVAATLATVQQARAAAAGGQAAELALHEAQAEAHRTTGDFLRDFYERRIFDKHLHFASPEDERAYREREEAYQRAIQAARAEGTPEGELRATRLAIAQLEDAGAHGATDSPDYARLHHRLTQNEANLTQALDKQPTPEKEAEMDAALAPSEPVLLPPELAAAFRDTGVTVADAGEGHGVSNGQMRASQMSRV